MPNDGAGHCYMTGRILPSCRLSKIAMLRNTKINPQYGCIGTS
jgi:hypothetical protein